MIQDILQQTFFNNSILNYLVSLSIFVTGVIAIRIFKSIVLIRLKKWIESTILCDFHRTVNWVAPFQPSWFSSSSPSLKK